MAEGAAAPKSEGPKAPYVGEVQTHPGAVVTGAADYSPLAQCAFSPSLPEAGAGCVMPHVRICAGGAS